MKKSSKRSSAQVAAAQVQRHLEDEAQFYRDLFLKQPDAELIVNRRGIIERCNEQALTFLGYSREELVDQSVTILLPDDAKRIHGPKIEAFFRNPFTRPMGVNLNIRVVAKIGENEYEEKPVTIYLAGVNYPRKGTRALAVLRSKDA